MSDFLTRTIVGVLGSILLVILIYFGGAAFNVFLLLLVLLALFELKNALENIGLKLNTIFIFLCSFAGFLELYIRNSIIMTIYLIFFLCSFDLLFLRNDIKSVAALCFALIYTVVGFYSIGMIQKKAYIGLVFVIAFSTDTFAYLCGRIFGEHPLIPKVSAHKTIEGSLGGMISTLIITCLYCEFFASDYGLEVHAITGLLGSVIAQIGDLTASRIKRDCKIKDFGKILPGHGGILDRFDSVIMVAPTLYFLYQFVF